MVREKLELAVQALIFYSLVMLFVELEVSPQGVTSGLFLWSERVVALGFTLEYLTRWIASRSWRYPLRPMAIIDLLSVLPFYLGFIVDPSSLTINLLLKSDPFRSMTF